MKLNKLVQTVLMVTCLIGTLASVNLANEPARFNSWRNVGPTGGDIRAIAIDPRDKNRIYATTLDSQVYTSPDAGRTWRLLVTFNKPLITLDDIIVDSEDSNRIYVSGHKNIAPGGFFYSTDAGNTWKESSDLKNEAIHGMAQSSKNPNLLIAGSAGRVFISYNRGENWKKVTDENVAFKAQLIDSAAFDPVNTDIIYVGTTWRAYKSTDGGKTWRLISKGMIDDSDVFAINIDPENPDHIISSACSGIYESYNGGELWTKVQGIPSSSRRTKAIIRNPTKNGEVYAGTTEGFWMSSNNGKTWALTSQRELEVNSIAVHVSEPNKVYVATNNYGLMVSNDGGRNFSIFNGNFTSRFIHDIIPDIERPNRFYATSNNTATGGGFFFVSDDGGISWKTATRNLSVNRVTPNTVLQDKTNPNILYLGTNVGIFRSIDRGMSWEQIKSKVTPVKTTKGKKSSTKTTVAKKMVNLSEIVNHLSYSNDGTNTIYAATEKGLFKTSNMLVGWEKVVMGAGISESIKTVHIPKNLNNTIWVGTVNSGVLVSRDNGLSWQKIKDVPSDYPIRIIETNPGNPDLVYVGNITNLYLSRDGGNSWNRRGGGLPGGYFNSIIFNPQNPNEVIVGSAAEGRGGVFQSLDGGTYWKEIETKSLGLPSRRVWSMAFDTKNPNKFLIGTHSGGIVRVERETSSALNETGSRPRVASNPN